MAINVLVVDDSAIVRKVLSDELDKHKDIHVVATAGNPVIARMLAASPGRGSVFVMGHALLPALLPRYSPTTPGGQRPWEPASTLPITPHCPDSSCGSAGPSA